ncbi:hypothetical protein ACFVXH_40085 [Kitasatospora sp. NPDC058184]|uniref:hypothetical protein n=1 Tax=Kitasatospora sp. NPDC058184 TaxID=3346370 RepID=UPI0036DBFBE9
MNSISHTLRLRPQGMASLEIVNKVAGHRAEGSSASTGLVDGDEYGAGLQGQYEEQVVALVIRDLTAADPAATVGAVNAVVAQVWAQAAEHVRRAGTTWTHISWFVQNAITEFVGGARPQMAGC